MRTIVAVYLLALLAGCTSYGQPVRSHKEGFYYVPVTVNYLLWQNTHLYEYAELNAGPYKGHWGLVRMVLPTDLKAKFVPHSASSKPGKKPGTTASPEKPAREDQETEDSSWWEK